MATHIADVPRPFYAYVCDQFLYDHRQGWGDFTRCMVYGVSSLPGRAWGLSVLLENGAMVQHLPVSAIRFDNMGSGDSHAHPLDNLQVWACYGWEFTTHIYDALDEMPVKAYLKGGVWETGRYLFTAAPYGDGYAMTPDQHKHFNFLQLDCGALAALPGNRMLCYDSSFVELPTERPRYVTNTQYWYVEGIDDDDPFDSVIDPDTSL